MILQIKKLHPDAKIPTRTNPTDSGLDLYSVEETTIIDGEQKMISIGIAIELPESTLVDSNNMIASLGLVWEAQVRPRSGLAAKHGITIVNSPGTIDNDYRGEVKVILRNGGKKPFEVKKGDRIAQLVVAPVVIPNVVEIDELSDTSRGASGFGASGR